MIYHLDNRLPDILFESNAVALTQRWSSITQKAVKRNYKKQKNPKGKKCNARKDSEMRSFNYSTMLFDSVKFFREAILKPSRNRKKKKEKKETEKKQREEKFEGKYVEPNFSKRENQFHEAVKRHAPRGSKG